jgi:tRNA-specific 2-thiouridylase
VHWIDLAPASGAGLTLQLRAHSPPARVTVAAVDTGQALLFCDPPVSQVAPGQAGVLYDGDEVVGGGTVS